MPLSASDLGTIPKNIVEAIGLTEKGVDVGKSIFKIITHVVLIIIFLYILWYLGRK